MSKIPGLIALAGLTALLAIGCSAPKEGDPTATNDSTSTTSGTTGTEPTAQDAFVMNAKPIIDASCKGCHSGAEPKGNIDVTKLNTEADAKANMDMIHEMAKEVEAKKMPPPNTVTLSDEDRAKLVAALKALG